jgi:hypothetical protein
VAGALASESPGLAVVPAILACAAATILAAVMVPRTDEAQVSPSRGRFEPALGGDRDGRPDEQPQHDHRPFG